MLDRQFWSYKMFCEEQRLPVYEPSDEAQTVSPAGIYKYIEDWWGDDFDGNLASRIAHAPIQHRVAFGLSFRVDCTPAKSQTGVLHPVLPEAVARTGPFLVSESGEALTIALRLLLYCGRVVIAQERLPLPHVQVIDRRDDDFPGFFAPEAFVESELLKLIAIRELVESETLQFGPLSQGAGFYETSDSWGSLVDDEELEAVLRQHTSYIDFGDLDPTANLRVQAGGVLSAMDLCGSIGGQIVAVTDIEEMVRDRLLKHTILDRRLMNVDKLASVKIPNITGNVQTLTRLRRSEGSFAEWRNHLSNAAEAVQGLSRQGGDLAHASSVLYENLMDGLAPIERSLKKSSAMRTASYGVRGFAVSGVSAATTGLVTGNPWAALASGAMGKVADSVFHYFETRSSERQEKLLLDLALSFKPDD